MNTTEATPNVVPAKPIGREQIIALKPCLRAQRDYETQIGAGYDSWVDLLKDETVAPKDRVWIGIKVLPDKKTQMEFLLWSAETAVSFVPEERRDKHVLNLLEVMKRFVNGEATRDELLAARREARYAYADAFATADATAYAYATAYATADAYAAAYAYATADAAATADAYAAAYADAAAAAARLRARQLERLIELLK